MRDFPGNLRGVILDGVLPPQVSFTEAGYANAAAALGFAAQRFVDSVRAVSGPPHCRRERRGRRGVHCPDGGADQRSTTPAWASLWCYSDLHTPPTGISAPPGSRSSLRADGCTRNDEASLFIFYDFHHLLTDSTY